jgi:hypothetical protein
MYAAIDLVRRWRRGDGAAAIERRLHRRAVRYWRDALGECERLLLDRFDAGAVEDRLDQGFLLDLRDRAAPVFARIAPVLQDEAEIAAEAVGLADVPGGSLLARFAAHYPKALATEQPVTAEYDFVTEAGWHVLCRGALLPLSSDGARVDHVYGVISWKSEKAG